MKNYYLLFACITALISNAQSIEIGAGLGSGAFYIIEDLDNNANTTYDAPASIYMDLKYNFKDRIDGLKLRLQNTNVNVEGRDYQTGIALDGGVESFTTLLMYERLRSDKVFNIGYQGGMGFTQQDFRQQKRLNRSALEDRFMSITVGGLYSLRLHDKLRLNLETDLLWTDPINTFKGADNWQTAGEDVSFLAQLGVSYNFK